MRFYAEAVAADYFNVHLGGLNNGSILGPNKPNGWSKWYKLDTGSYTYTLAAEAVVDGKVIQCDHHNQEFTIAECESGCVKPPEPKCRYAPAVYEPVTCTYTCPPCTMPLPPECRFGPPTPDYEACAWECPLCESCVDATFDVSDSQVTSSHDWCMSVDDGEEDCFDPGTTQIELPEAGCGTSYGVEFRQFDNSCDVFEVCNEATLQVVGDECPQCEENLPNEACYRGNIDTAAHLFDYFGITMTRIYHSGGYWTACRLAERSADLVVVKGGPGFNLYTNVNKFQLICTCSLPSHGGPPDISHISYFNCPGGS